MEEKRIKFLKIYSQLPESHTKQIVISLEGKYYNWEEIANEVKKRTFISNQLLNELINKQII